ncbi:PP2C family protein-serine/threonine phosphatase [Catellatospora sp. NPDC049609]|uniref:PP2C family protein-serine/threonine phosphatase n=1 Tax=Catellatospora sp. NPDC049609 TaxID=3155505 RepID=UPI0034174B23
MSEEISTMRSQHPTVCDPVVAVSLAGSDTVPRPAPTSGNGTVDGFSRQPWAELLDGSEEMVFAVDRDGLVRVANAAAARHLGLTAGQAVAATPLATVLQGPPGSFDADLDDRRLRGRSVPLGEWTAWYVRDVTDQTFRIDALLAERWRSAFLAEAGRRLGSSLNRARAARTTALLAVPALADCAVVVLADQRELVWHRADVDAEDRAESTGSLARWRLEPDSALDQALAGLTVQDDPRLGEQIRPLLADGFGAVGSATVLPLPGHGAPVGALILARHAGRAPFEAVEVHLVRQYAARAGAAISAAALYAAQADAAELVQRSLEPPELPQVPGVALGAAYRPAWEPLRIGGDFYDVQAGPDGDWMFVLGDVCGKGIEAALQSGNLRQSLRALWLAESRPLRLLDQLNRATLTTGDPTLATLVVGSLTTGPAGDVTLTLATGGHPPPLLLRAAGEVAPVELAGTAIGLVPAAPLGETRVVLAPGDTLVLYTDGVTEARGRAADRPFFGAERFATELGAYRAAPAAVIAERIAQLVADWTGDRLHDDVAVLVIQARPGPATPDRATREDV